MDDAKTVSDLEGEKGQTEMENMDDAKTVSDLEGEKGQTERENRDDGRKVTVLKGERREQTEIIKSKFTWWCFDRTFWMGKQKLFIAYRLLVFFVLLIAVVSVGSMVSVFFNKEILDSKFIEIVTIVIYGGFNIISLTIGFVAGASLDKPE